MKLILCLIMLCPALSTPALAATGDTEALRLLVAQWKDAWQHKEIERYLSFYSPHFRHKGRSVVYWSNRKRKILNRPGALSIDIQGLSVMVEGDRAAAQFVQRFQSPFHSDVGEKHLTLSKEGGRWLIVSETWQPLKLPTYFPPERNSHQTDMSPLPPETAGGVSTEAEMEPAEDIEEQSSSSLQKATETDVSPSVMRDTPVLDDSPQDIGIRHRKIGEWEQVCIRISHPFVPVVFPIEDNRPRLVVDISNVTSWNASPSISSGGVLVRRIRSYLHQSEGRLRVVMDLAPADNYTVSQRADPANNTHCLLIK